MEGATKLKPSVFTGEAVNRGLNYAVFCRSTKFFGIINPARLRGGNIKM